MHRNAALRASPRLRAVDPANRRKWANTALIPTRHRDHLAGPAEYAAPAGIKAICLTPMACDLQRLLVLDIGFSDDFSPKPLYSCGSLESAWCTSNLPLCCCFSS